MSVVTNIMKTYRTPVKTFARLFEAGPSEKVNLAYLIGGCFIYFISQWPLHARNAFDNQLPVEGLMATSMLTSLFFLPLVFYFISWVGYCFAKIFGSKITSVEMRLILFWAYFSTAPIMLLRGLTAGFFNENVLFYKNTEYLIVTIFWFLALLLFIYSGFKGRAK